MKNILSITGLVLIAIILLFVSGWCLLMLAFAGPDSEWLRYVLALIFIVTVLVALPGLFIRRHRWQMLSPFFLCFLSALIWYGQIEPSNDRDWQPDVVVVPSATIDGDIVTVKNIRNFDYRSEFDYTSNYYDKQYDLRELTGVDVVAAYWMGPAVAHIFLSFEFANDEHLAVSIETRKEKGEAYSTLKGFFRNYELYYVVGDERDLIRLRTNYRQDPPEDVYVYRVTGSLEQAQKMFMEYMRQINALNNEPQFYNTLTSNCTTTIWLNSHVNEQHLPLHWKLLVSGYLPELLYEYGKLQTGGLSFDELQQQVLVNERAQKADTATDFSRRIRRGSPAIVPLNTVLQEEGSI